MKLMLLKTTLCTALLTGFVTVVLAQKNDEIQGESRFAPRTIKIDGKNFEWKDTDFSVSKRTGLSYIVSNDDKNLYLIIKSTDVTNNEKIMAGGITFSVNPEGKRIEKESIRLTYPVVEQLRTGSTGSVVVSYATSNVKNPEQDAYMAARHKKKLEKAKEIKIRGFKNTTDTLLSIYNDLGIKTFANIEKDNSFFCEVSIPLEGLGISIKGSNSFAYNVKVNGIQMPGLDNNRIIVAPPPGVSGGNFDGGMDDQAMTSSTDFWGKYKLAKH
ncbi:hypothetical protein [Pedobacter nyackensis]|uniref:hypothetical protein n=1 Tax=Pedobacter nyackensis TaxID=475255 RepID=UPI002930DB37|nr:hypothetical protein [Pedobacter nyackensis]